MAKRERQKAKLLYLQKIFLERTDEEHPLSTAALIAALEEYGVSAERKSIYSDVAELCAFGMDIVRTPERAGGYYLASREFETAELKLLVDAVQSSRFITKKKTEGLIRKLEGLAGRRDKSKLERQVFVSNRIKTMNESVFYAVDALHEAISEDRCVSFLYYDWNEKKEKVARHGGREYLVSPLSLIWDDENYYLAAVDRRDGILKNYRVDRMARLRVRPERREKKELSKSFDPALYSKRMFGMYGGEVETVLLRCENRMANVIIDRFGTEPPFLCRKEGTFDVPVSVAVSPLFLAWIINFGGAIEILSPGWVRAELVKLAQSAAAAHAGAPEEGEG
ncbi:MAG: WYL domain-containing protein [Clostridia bacterium]|nr:WYL domain-containing protein [Clostridia bacterium]